jgi:hypothetical protein
MRILSIFILSLVTGMLAAQTPVTKIFATMPGQKIVFQFDYPEVIKVSTWERNEIQVTGKVSINGGENDNAFEITQTPSGNTVRIEGRVKNIKQLPHRYTINRGEEKLTFKTLQDFEKYKKENGRDFNFTSTGVDIDITLEIKVPRNMETKIEATYGIVEVKDFTGPLTVDATYGGVDVVVQTKTTGELIAETGYGEIYSNLDVKFSGAKLGDFHTQVSVKPGTGPRYSFESRYGNVYLRKPL